MKTLLCCLSTVSLLALSGCSSTREAELDSWVKSPATQQEIGTLENFAFDLLNTYLETHVLATGSDGSPNFAAAETAVIPAVRAKYGLTLAQATYVVRQAEAGVLSQP
jgi:hypothetical protein